MRLDNQPPPTQAAHAAALDVHAGGVTVTPGKPGKLLRLPAVEELTGLKKSTIYNGVKAGTFVAPVRLSARAVAWREADVLRWCADRVAVNQGGHHAAV